jgi:SAM-dependent methyltransferase
MKAPAPAPAVFLELQGQCPICEAPTTFRAENDWLRDSLLCVRCGSIPRERALARVLHEKRPHWRRLAIHEASPVPRGITRKMQLEAPGYVPTHFVGGAPLGKLVGGVRNENLEAQTFADESFDLVVTQDVFEHLFDPAAATREIWRTLKPGGAHLCTFPISKHRADAVRWRARRNADGTVEHMESPEYHSGGRDLVTVDYGHDIHRQIADWAPFDVSIVRASNRAAGVLGEFTEVIVCQKA